MNEESVDLYTDFVEVDDAAYANEVKGLKAKYEVDTNALKKEIEELTDKNKVLKSENQQLKYDISSIKSNEDYTLEKKNAEIKRLKEMVSIYSNPKLLSKPLPVDIPDLFANTTLHYDPRNNDDCIREESSVQEKLKIASNDNPRSKSEEKLKSRSSVIKKERDYSKSSRNNLPMTPEKRKRSHSPSSSTSLINNRFRGSNYSSNYDSRPEREEYRKKEDNPSNYHSSARNYGNIECKEKPNTNQYSQRKNERWMEDYGSMQDRVEKVEKSSMTVCNETILNQARKMYRDDIQRLKAYNTVSRHRQHRKQRRHRGTKRKDRKVEQEDNVMEANSEKCNMEVVIQNFDMEIAEEIVLSSEDVDHIEGLDIVLEDSDMQQTVVTLELCATEVKSEEKDKVCNSVVNSNSVDLKIPDALESEEITKSELAADILVPKRATEATEEMMSQYQFNNTSKDLEQFSETVGADVVILHADHSEFDDDITESENTEESPEISEGKDLENKVKPSAEDDNIGKNIESIQSNKLHVNQVETISESIVEISKENADSSTEEGELSSDSDALTDLTKDNQLQSHKRQVTTEFSLKSPKKHKLRKYSFGSKSPKKLIKKYSSLKSPKKTERSLTSRRDSFTNHKRSGGTATDTSETRERYQCSQKPQSILSGPLSRKAGDHTVHIRGETKKRSRRRSGIVQRISSGQKRQEHQATSGDFVRKQNGDRTKSYGRRQKMPSTRQKP